MGAGLASIAHAFSRRITRLLIPSTGCSGIAPPWGTHPLLDPNFSGSDLEVRHDGVQLSRLQKTAIVSEWAAAMSILQCCLQNEGIPEAINCGRCGKCLRTMVQLAALGKLEMTPTFPHVRITPQTIDAAEFDLEGDVGSLEECIEPFERMGRLDLVQAIRDRIKRYRDRVQGRGWRNAIRRWDRKLTHGRLAGSARRVLRHLKTLQGKGA